MNFYVKVAVVGLIGLILAGPLGALGAWVLMLLIATAKKR